MVGILLATSVWIYLMRGLPSLDNLENEKFFRESTVIYDKDGNEIYSIFKDGRRTNIGYNDISKTIIHAVVSTEDRTFFENPGIDILGLVRVGATYVTGGRFGRVGWASTISQQLIKNTLLTNEVTIKRKAQEAFLSYKMNNQYSKEKILEMYLNTISFWHNASGVEQASRTFFGKSANDVWPLGATILASIINAPTRFSPYIHRDRLMGKLEVYPTDDTTNRIVLETFDQKELYAPLYEEFKSYLSGITVERRDSWVYICGVRQDYIKDDFVRKDSFLPNKDGCTSVDFESLWDFFGNISFAKNLELKENSGEYRIEYTIWRKDFVAKQLLEDNKIDGETYKKIIYDGIDFEFKKYVENIKYPYFVMYVKEYLETKYGKDIDITSGLRVYTTIDPRLQEKAEAIIKKQVETNRSLYWASSAALVSMDNVTGKLLSMVGGADYFDTKNGGNNNMTLARRQPGSSFKPFIYALAIAKNPIGPESPVADTDTKFGSWEPNNYDGKFLWIMAVKNALNYSRNIPAGKMYFLAGQQDEIVKMMRNFGITTLKEEKEYSYGGPLALGAGEVKPIELMEAYSVFANNGKKRGLYSIERIETNDGIIIEEHTPEYEREVFSPAAAYIINKMLSDVSAKPDSAYWRNALSVGGGRLVAVKTGTANKPAKKWGTTILPWDLWTAGYTPQITTVVWAGNVDGWAMKPKAESLNSAAPIWREYMEFALTDLPKADWQKPKDVYAYNIVKSSGKLATKNTPEWQTVSTLMAVQFNQYDEWLKEIRIDNLCNGIATENTPPDAIQTIYIPSGKPIIDGYDPEWTKSFYTALRAGQTGSGGITTPTYSDAPCETRPATGWNVTFSIERLDETTAKIGFLGNSMIQTLRIIPEGSDDIVIWYGTWTKKNGTETIKIPANIQVNIRIDAIDIYGFKYSESRILSDVSIPSIPSWSVGDWGDIEPSIVMINPKSQNLNLYSWDPFNLRFRVDIPTATREIQVLVDDTIRQTATSGELFVIPMSSAWLSIGTHTVKVKAIDGNFQSTEKSFTLTILAR